MALQRVDTMPPLHYDHEESIAHTLEDSSIFNGERALELACAQMHCANSPLARAAQNKHKMGLLWIMATLGDESTTIPPTETRSMRCSIVPEGERETGRSFEL